MTEEEHTGPNPSGPWVQAACFCDKVLQERDDVLSLIRVVDRFTVTQQGSRLENDQSAIEIRTTMVLMLKAGEARGTHTITIRPQAPSGLYLDSFEASVLFESEDRGQNLVMNLNYTVAEAGLYWFDVLVEGRLISRLPLRIVRQRLSA